jgi:hypothetical protein
MNQSKEERNKALIIEKTESQANSTQHGTGEASIQEVFDTQKAYFATDVTKTYEWRIEQLDRLTRMLKDNYKRFADASCRDFKTAAQEKRLRGVGVYCNHRIHQVSTQRMDETGRSPYPKVSRCNRA